MKFHEAVARTLKDQGISVVFGVIGDGNLFMMSSFQSCVSGNYFSMANEASAVLASSGYARTWAPIRSCVSDSWSGFDQHGHCAHRKRQGSDSLAAYHRRYTRR